MAIQLGKGQKVELTKSNPGLSKIMIGLGWDVTRFGGDDFDLDASVFMCDDTGKVPTDTEFIFYGNLEHSSNSVKHMGDNLTGAGDGDDEQIMIDLSLIPSHITRIVFPVTIHEAESRGQNFGQLSNSYIRVVDTSTNSEILNYDLGEDFSIETAVVAGELYKSNGEWKFNAIGSGFNGGLRALCTTYGVDVA